MAGPTRETAPQQAPAQENASRFEDAGDAYDQIQPFLEAQFDFREAGIDYICNELRNVDDPSLGETLLKAGLKIGLGAAAAALGPATAAYTAVSLAAIGAGFAVGSEIVDAVFSGNSAPSGIEGYRLGRKNTLYEMKARESSALRAALNEVDPSLWDRAYEDYQNSRTNVGLQQLEKNSTLDGWMNALNAQNSGTGGSIGQGSEGSRDSTTGRLYIFGSITRDSSDQNVVIRLHSARMDGLDNNTLRSEYLGRTMGDIGMFVDLDVTTEGMIAGALQMNAGGNAIGREGTDLFDMQMSYMAADHDGEAFSQERCPPSQWAAGARRIQQIMSGQPLRSFGLSSIEGGGGGGILN